MIHAPFASDQRGILTDKVRRCMLPVALIRIRNEHIIYLFLLKRMESSDNLQLRAKLSGLMQELEEGSGYSFRFSEWKDTRSG